MHTIDRVHDPHTCRYDMAIAEAKKWEEQSEGCKTGYREVGN
jgi:hypothetical protein